MRRFLTAAAFLAMAHASASAQSYTSQYFELPKGDYPHDVAAAPDGTVW